MEEGRRGLPLGALQGTGAEIVVEGGGHRGCSGVSGGGIGWQVAVGGENAQGGRGG